MSTTNSLRSGDLSARVQELAYDELDRVGQTINIMAEELAKHSRDLKRTNDELMGLNAALYVLGADDYLIKPFNKETLLNTLQNVIASKREMSQVSQRQAQPVSKRSR